MALTLVRDLAKRTRVDPDRFLTLLQRYEVPIQWRAEGASVDPLLAGAILRAAGLIDAAPRVNPGPGLLTFAGDEEEPEAEEDLDPERDHHDRGVDADRDLREPRRRPGPSRPRRA